MFDCQILDKNIYYYTNIYDNKIDFFEKIKNELSWREWLSSDSKTLYGMVAGGINVLPEEILLTIKKSVYQCLYDYCLKTGNSFGWVPEYYTINRYNTSAYMGPHVDSTDKTVSKAPTISIVIYINDNYEGGELSFPEQNITIKPEAASMVIFPSYPPYYHDPKPVTSGDKYMSPVFCFREPF